MIWEVFDAHPGSTTWIPAARTERVRRNLPYASSLIDAEWVLIAPHYGIRR